MGGGTPELWLSSEAGAEVQLVLVAKLVVSALRQGTFIICIKASYWLGVLFKSPQARGTPSHYETCYQLPSSGSSWAFRKACKPHVQGRETLAPPAINKLHWVGD